MFELSLSALVRSATDSVARVGGDELVVIPTGVVQQLFSITLAERNGRELSGAVQLCR